MQLVIAEKPSVAEDLTRVLPGQLRKHEGYWEGPEHIVSYAVGHLLELASPEDYDPELRRWSLQSLPILPEAFRRKARPGQGRRLQLLKKLASRPDVTSLVNACDAAREGELIFREIEEHLRVRKPVQRLWLQSMTAEAIQQAFRELKPAAGYDRLAAAAFCRSEADWLIGMNATRAITRRLKSRKEKGVWSAGRVQTPTLALLVRRELAVLAHEPRPYWRLRATLAASGHCYQGLWRASRSGKDAEKIWSSAEAEALRAACAGRPAEASEEVTESARAAPPLHSLTSLQKEANQRFGLSASRTLAAAQRLYEQHKLVTYPRTDSSALPSDYRGHVQRAIGVLAQARPAALFVEAARGEAVADAARQLGREGLRNEGRNFDDQKVGDHFAIVPTAAQPAAPLGGDDAKVFELVVRRFLAAFMAPSVWQKVARETRARAADGAVHTFFTEASRLVRPGWQLVDRRPPKEELLEPLGVPPGTAAAAEVVELAVEEDQTRPPARYTEASLLRAMEEASDLDLDLHDEIDDEDAVAALRQKGLGTPATRAEIIEGLLARGYALRTGKSLRPTAKGIVLVDFLQRVRAEHLAKAELTAEMEFHLYQVEQGQRERQSYMNEVVAEVRGLVERLREFEYEELYRDDPPLGPCPVDGEAVREGLRGYSCQRAAAEYEVELRPRKARSRSLPGVAAALAERCRGLEARPRVAVEPADDRVRVRLRLDQPHSVAAWIEELEDLAEEAVGERSVAFEVRPLDPRGCGWTLWKECRGRYVNRPVAEKLLRDGDSGPLEGFVTRRGQPYAGRLRLRRGPEPQVEFEPVRGLKLADADGAVEPELASFPVNPEPLGPCPRCGQGRVVETPTHFECRRGGAHDREGPAAPGCGLSLPRSVCKRELRREEVLPYMDPAVGRTDWLESFVSRRGRPFTARLVRKPNGRHGFEFRPRERRRKGAAARAPEGAAAALRPAARPPRVRARTGP